MAKNLGPMIKNVPSAVKKAEEHLTKAIELSKSHGANSILGWANRELGLFYQTRKKYNRARKCLSEAIQIFEKNEAEGYLKQAQEAMQSLRD
jgi:tetratricopeptide (TPR) repeat protein